jgi:hypothetical protein
MKIQQFLEHHQVTRNPFAEEDAQTDPVFKDYCIVSTYHPTWDKIYGDPTEPATAIVFGEKGSGKTAMRLQIARHLTEFNRENPGKRLLVVHYDDFNPFLDRFRERMHGRKRRAERMLAEWKLWDHMDAILSLGVTGVIDRILDVRQPSTAVDGEVHPADIEQLDRHQSRDLLLLAACYDQSTAETFKGRWHRLRRRLHYPMWKSQLPLIGGYVGTVLVATCALLAIFYEKSSWLTSMWYLWLIALLAVWTPWLWRQARCMWLAAGVLRRTRVGNHALNPLRHVLTQFPGNELSAQPLPNKDSTDSRYELLLKFQGMLQTLGFRGIVVLVDRVDEPHLINGSADLMRALVWPMLDNKFLKHPGLGLKLMLPVELTRFIDREGRDFYQRARLDKQNMVASFQWSGEALYDVANARIRACAEQGAAPSLRDLFADSVTEQRLLEIMRTLRVPRHLFKFMYRLLVDHCNAYTDQEPTWTISAQTMEATLAVYQRDQDAFDRGTGAG